MDSGSPFAALLIGQPTPQHRLRLGVLAALDHPISVRYALAGMTPQDIAGYLAHHLKIAGRADALFSTDAVTGVAGVAVRLPVPAQTDRTYGHLVATGFRRSQGNRAVGALMELANDPALLGK